MCGEEGGRESLRAVAAIVGVPVTVTHDETWRLDERGLRVGLGWYTIRGHSDAEATALTLLQLWQVVRGQRLEPEHAARVRLLKQARADLEPLISAITRAQAAADVITVFPGIRGALVAGLNRGLPASLLAESPRDQWLALVLTVGFGHRESVIQSDDLDAGVAHEWRLASEFGGASGDGVWRVIQADTTRPALERFERAIALLSPGYERLQQQDLADKGLGAAGGASPPDGGSENPRPEQSHQDSTPGNDDAEDGSDGPDESAGDGRADRKEPEKQPGQGPQGSEADNAEGADLFQADQTGQVTSFLETPLPASSIAATAFASAAAPPGVSGPKDLPAVGSGRSVGAANAEYAARITNLSPQIGQMREVWHTVTTERVADVVATGRYAQAEGESLDPRTLASGIAQLRAGATKPRVFLQRQHRRRRASRSGNTDYVMLIDRSASMQGRPAQAAVDTAVVMLEGLAAAARDIVQAETSTGVDLELQLRTALIVFDSRAHLVKPLSSGMSDEVRQELLAAITAPQGSTNDAAALKLASDQLHQLSEARQRRRIVFLISDGGTNDPAASGDALRRLRGEGVEVWGIGLGSDDLRERFAPTGARVDDPAQLVDAISALIRHSTP